MLSISSQLTLNSSLSITPAFAGMQSLAYLGDKNTRATASDTSSGLYETDSGEIYLRPKTPAEAAGERILRPAVDAIHSFFSKLPSLSSWAWVALTKGLDIPPFSLPVTAAEPISHKEEDIQLQQNENSNFQTRYDWHLHWGIEEGDTEKVSHFLANGADPDLQTSNGWTLLYRAASEGNTEIASLLLANGADPDLQTSNGWTPLYWAILKGNTEMTSLLLENGADPNRQDSNGLTHLYQAAQGKNTEIASLLLANGADPNFQDEKGRTPLYAAIKFGNTEMTSLLLDNGADPNYQASNGLTCLQYASLNGYREVTELLKAHGAKVPTFPILTSKQFLILSATVCTLFASKTRIKNLFRNSLQWAASKTNLHWAAYLNKDASVSALIKGGHSVNAVDSTGSTPLHLAMSTPGTGPRARSFFETSRTKSLAIRAMGLSATNYTQASSENTLATANTLLQSRADLSIRNQRGMSPLDMTIVADSPHFPRLELIDSLIQHGAEQHLEDNSAQTLQHYQENHPCDDVDFAPAEARLAFEHLSEASDGLERDKAYPQFVCPITNCHIWDPVLDPTDGKTVYERNAIVQWLQQNPAAIRTRQPLTEDQLLELPTLRNYLQKRAVQHLRESHREKRQEKKSHSGEIVC